MNRNQAYGLVHKGMKAMLQHQFTDDAYRAEIQKLTGQDSCKKMTDAQLTAVVEHLTRKGFLASRGARNNPNRPTQAQWRKLAAMSYSMGWNGLDDAALLTFVQRTAKVDHVKFLTKPQITDVITGLMKWSQ
ncbi:regulatory protein GemA [Shewanella halifaxensis]|uniref:regulatory protein GemA n=1 Tax=Shewanella halifaxensis TaxID=271098 RepID=UPI000D596EB4|nr:regulatory protein GemA [Shewanella halifaxensis]